MALSEKRTGRITGSVAGAILGLSPFMDADDVLRRMVRDYHGAQSEFTGNVATQYGSFHEPGAIVDFQMETGFVATANEDFFIHPEHDWLGATPDGFVSDGALIEIKCPYGKRDSGEFKSIEDQQHYYAQMQIEMACTGKQRCWFYQWSAHNSEAVCVSFDDEWFAAALPVLAAFHTRYLSELDNPDHLEAKRTIVETPLAAKLMEEYHDLAEAIDKATERKKEVLADLIVLAGARNATICGHKLTQVEREGAVSYAKALKKYAPDADLEPFRGKPTSYWRLS
jgi:putative phage-type endonuclease